MLSINKELLLARLKYLEEINKKPGSEPVDPKVGTKIREMIEEGDVISYMALESVYTYLKEKLKEDRNELDEYAKEIIAFIS